MSRVFALPIHATFTPSSLILVATRSWRSARDSGRPVQPALFHALNALRVGMLAPAFASLIEFYESSSGRPIRVGGPYAAPSADERRLIGLLDASGDGETMMPEATANKGLARALRVSLRSTRIMMRLALETVGDIPRPRVLRSRSPERRPGRFARRNRSLSAAVEILREGYPVTFYILGEPRFEAVASAFARRHPPANPVPIGYGDGFAAFLAKQSRIKDFPSLVDVATLERLRTEARIAVDAPALELTDLPLADDAGWEALRLPLHPAAGIAWLTTPAVTIWQAHHDGSAALPPAWRAEGALVTRPAGQVALRPIDRPEHRLLFGLRLRESVGQAAVATTALYPDADIPSVIASLVTSGAFAKPLPKILA